jgi:hypothetical protein
MGPDEVHRRPQPVGLSAAILFPHRISLAGDPGPSHCRSLSVASSGSIGPAAAISDLAGTV